MAGTEELLGPGGRLMEKTYGDRLGKNLVKKRKTQKVSSLGDKEDERLVTLCHPSYLSAERGRTVHKEQPL